MRILIIGEGGRESALAAKLQNDPRISKMFFANGNATTDVIGKNVHLSEIKELRDFAIKEKVDLTIVGPEAPLVAGLKDEFKKHDLKVFGPNQKVASLEGSKAFSKKFMQTYDIKTAKAVVFDSYNEAKEYVQTHQFPLVVKASGLAGGKGVVICDTLEEAEATIHDFMIRRIHGDAGIRLVIEEYLEGFEASIIAFQTVKNYSLVSLQKTIKKQEMAIQDPIQEEWEPLRQARNLLRNTTQISKKIS